jgi:predicted MFS family arabinose efflux permease
MGLLGTDLVLPAVPQLPEIFDTTASSAQLVLAAYVGGACAGLLLFGSLSERVATGRLFAGSLIATCVLSLACGMAASIETLIFLRVLQGAAAAAPAVFAPALIKATFDERRAIRAMGLLGSMESLAPALAPLAGAGLLLLGGWQLSFFMLAVIAGALALVLGLSAQLPQVGRRPEGSYAALLRDVTFLRYALSHAFVLGGLLTFVFGLPAVIVRVLDGTMGDFVLIQMAAIAMFIVSANVADRAATRFGAERIILSGTALCAAGAAGQLLYALAGGSSLLIVLALFAPVNIGLGLRGPPGFYRAVVASHGDDARGAVLVTLCILAIASGGTVLAAPFIADGLFPLASIAFALHAAALVCLVTLPMLPGSASGMHWRRP